MPRKQRKTGKHALVTSGALVIDIVAIVMLIAESFFGNTRKFFQYFGC